MASVATSVASSWPDTVATASDAESECREDAAECHGGAATYVFNRPWALHGTSAHLLVVVEGSWAEAYRPRREPTRWNLSRDDLAGGTVPASKWNSPCMETRTAVAGTPDPMGPYGVEGHSLLVNKAYYRWYAAGRNLKSHAVHDAD